MPAPYARRVPAWLLWLLPVLLAVPVTVAWLSWTGRARRPVGTADTVAGFERFRDALARPMAAPDEAPRS